MFKNILPSKSQRIASSDFTMVTPLVENGKENKPDTKKPGLVSKGFKKKPNDDTSHAFNQLLDDLQIPPTLRPKLAGMDNSVKAAMLKSSQGMTLNLKNQNNSPPSTPRKTTLRRRSIESLDSPHAALRSDLDLVPPRPPFAVQEQQGSPSRKSSHSRGISLGSGFMSRSQVNLNASSSVLDLTAIGGGKPGKDKAVSRSFSPRNFISILQGTSSVDLDIESIKKLRLLLRNESASWTQDFLSQGGYSALLTRLNEILEIEWREEQHDDQVLHELLRCFKALSTSSIGCYALRSSSPAPFTQLVSLLYSDKKPGDVATRQLIVELITMLFELYPASSLPSTGNTRIRSEVWDSPSSPTSSNIITLPPPHKSLFSFLRALLLTPAPPSAEAELHSAPVSPHEFIESLHKPRVYKTYLQELSDICRDYFWVFCHPNNTIWILKEVDEGRVEKPRAPGGMTGGVEFEAMNYFTTHLRFMNALAKSALSLSLPRTDPLSAYQFHADLFLSGFERLLLISRKASTTYYPTLHLELSRYVALAGEAGYEMPWTVSRLMGLPPAGMCKVKPSAANTSGTGSRAGTPSGARAPGSPSRRGTSSNNVNSYKVPQTPPRGPSRMGVN